MVLACAICSSLSTPVLFYASSSVLQTPAELAQVDRPAQAKPSAVRQFCSHFRRTATPAVRVASLFVRVGNDPSASSKADARAGHLWPANRDRLQRPKVSVLEVRQRPLTAARYRWNANG